LRHRLHRRGARITLNAPAIAALVGLAEALAGAEVVLAGEGRFDESSLSGKVVGSLLESAASAGVPVGHSTTVS
jgi:glycerate kinase